MLLDLLAGYNSSAELGDYWEPKMFQFEPIKGTDTPPVTGAITARWALRNPDPVVKISVRADTTVAPSGRVCVQFTVAEPYLGVATPAATVPFKGYGGYLRPTAGGASPYVSGSLWASHAEHAPTGGVKTVGVAREAYAYGRVVHPRVVKNPTVEQLLALF